MQVDTMKLLVHFNSHGRSFENEPVSIKEAFYLIETHQDMREEPENYIGFSYPGEKDTVLQFIRIDHDNWIIDIPMYKENNYIASIQSKIGISAVFAIVHEYYSPTEFQKAMREHMYEKIKKICKNRWGITFNQVLET